MKELLHIKEKIKYKLQQHLFKDVNGLPKSSC